jgi:hypothetical protein
MAFRAWKARGYLERAPQFVKEAVLLKYGLPGAQWVESGTYRGTTTQFLSASFPYVHSIEPSPTLYIEASKLFRGSNVELHNGLSEVVLPELLERLSGPINFWLDGHFSAGDTFQGPKSCPVEDELEAISSSLGNFSAVTVMVDDVRCFGSSLPQHSEYPSLDELVDWARDNSFKWAIEHDILVMSRKV